jgi:hypothetical protein
MYELKKVIIQWPQLVRDRPRHIQTAHNDTQNNHINSEYNVKLCFYHYF